MWLRGVREARRGEARRGEAHAHLRIDTSASLRHSRIVTRCRWTASESACTTLSSVFNATYLPTDAAA